MRYRTLGRSGDEVSILGLGCMRLPVIDGDEGCIDEAQASRLLHLAVERGINYLDTAYPYHKGQSEIFLGRALRGGLRQKFRLATKLPSWAVVTAADFDRFLNEQLQRLETDHIDYYLLHALKTDWWHKLEGLGVLEFLERAITDGRIGAAGFSFHDELPVFRQIVDSRDWSFCQIQFNYMDEQIEENSRIADGARPDSLTDRELQVIGQVRDHLRQRTRVPCTACGYCLPCPAGVNTPRISGLYNDCFIHDDHRFPHRLYTSTMNSAELADNCTGCGRCEALCPQHIPIIDLLVESHRVLSEKIED